ncbi:hypothetical protein BGX33_007034 [Mortierella sp. NVP41]|nr:hypothetical protein BGX33_007034 [Mortierella sp. NVP41]
MPAFDFSGFAGALEESQSAPSYSVSLSGKRQRCSNTDCPVLNYDEINTHLCSYHETYMRGVIFRKRFPDFETTALLTNTPSITNTGENAQDIQLTRRGKPYTIISGTKLDDLTAGLHHDINPAKHRELVESDSKFAVKYRQDVMANGMVNRKRLEKLEGDCTREGYVYVVEIEPKAKAVKKMDDEGQEAAEDALAVMVGFTTDLKTRLKYVQECSANVFALATFPPTPRHRARCGQPVAFVALVAGIVHEMLVAHQHDIWCSCKFPNGTTHTQIYWFQDLTTAAPFDELMDSLAPRIRKWVDALKSFKWCAQTPLMYTSTRE